MKVCDFASSYLTFVTKGRFNTARIQIESRCELTSAEAESEEFFLIAGCRAEDTHAEKALFKVPNYEFCGVFSRNDYLLIRTHARAEDNNPTLGPNTDFDEVRIDVVMAPAEVLETNAAVVQATLANRRLVGRTEISEPGAKRSVLLEYPVKTMNVNPERNCFQVDTGPLAFLDWSANADSLVERFRLAHVAFNRPDRAEFILQVPTPVFEGAACVTKVNHYSEVREVRARNMLLALEA